MPGGPVRPAWTNRLVRLRPWSPRPGWPRCQLGHAARVRRANGAKGGFRRPRPAPGSATGLRAAGPATRSPTRTLEAHHLQATSSHAPDRAFALGQHKAQLLGVLPVLGWQTLPTVQRQTMAQQASLSAGRRSASLCAGSLASMDCRGWPRHAGVGGGSRRSGQRVSHAGVTAPGTLFPCSVPIGHAPSRVSTEASRSIQPSGWTRPP